MNDETHIMGALLAAELVIRGNLFDSWSINFICFKDHQYSIQTTVLILLYFSFKITDPSFLILIDTFL